ALPEGLCGGGAHADGDDGDGGEHGRECGGPSPGTCEHAPAVACGHSTLSLPGRRSPTAAEVAAPGTAAVRQLVAERKEERPSAPSPSLSDASGRPSSGLIHPRRHSK